MRWRGIFAVVDVVGPSATFVAFATVSPFGFGAGGACGDGR